MHESDINSNEELINVLGTFSGWQYNDKKINVDVF